MSAAPTIIYWTKSSDKKRIETLQSLCLKVSVFQDLKEGDVELSKNHYDIILIANEFLLDEILSFTERIKKRNRGIAIIIEQKDYNTRNKLIAIGATDVIVPELFQKLTFQHILLNAVHNAELDRQKRESVVQLKKLENRLSTIVGNTPVILFMLDKHGVFKMGLGKHWERFKVNKQFVLGQNIQEVYDEYPAFIDAQNNALNGEAQSISININNIIFEIVLTPLLDSKNEVKEVLGLAHDVTERALSEMSLIKSKKLAENAAKMKEEFIANMSHEIRTPMNAIVGFINLLEETKLNDVQRDYVESVMISSENLLSLINSILDFSKIESGTFTHESETFDLNHVINSIDKVLLLKVIEKKITFSQNVAATVPLELIGDANRLYQVLTNLLANSIKFTEKGSVSLNIDCLKVEDGIANLRFTVKDTGIGIPEAMIHKVFDSFTQVNPESNRKYGGTGLGLSIVKKIVKQLKGSISLTSKLRVGTEFIIEIPFKIADDFQERKNRLGKSTKHLKLPEGVKILLAEDNVMNQKLVLLILKKFKVTVDLAETGVEAIKALKSNDYDLILMDIQMPDMDGIEATKIIRKEFSDKKKNIPIIAMTAHAFQEELDKCLIVGMNDHIIKPIDTELFINKVNACLEKGDNQLSLDLTYLSNMFNDDYEMITEICNTFMEEMPEILNDIQIGIVQHNGEHTARMAHKAKASFKMMGMDKTVESLIQMEKYSKSGELDKLPSLYQFIKSQFDLSVLELKSNKLLVQ